LNPIVQVLIGPVVIVLWYHYWIWRMSKDTKLSYWTCARSLFGYATGDKDAVKKLRWVKNVQNKENKEEC